MLKKRLIVMVLLISSTPFFGLAADGAAAVPQAFLPESIYEFTPVVEGTKVEHDFVIHNQGDAPLRIIKLKSG